MMKQITPFIWEIPKSHRKDMRVPARIFASKAMLEDGFKDRTLDQLVNVATLPGIQLAAYAMPDAHEGYGFPIGGVAAMQWPDGVISPGGIGYDINCGVRLLTSKMTFEDVKDRLGDLARSLFHWVPSGVGRSGRLKLKTEELDQVLKNGVQWMVKNGYGTKEDLEHIESNGCLENADPEAVSPLAKKRGHDQLGTMGAGNHFVEVDTVDKILFPEAAEAMGLFPKQIVVLIHTGSRGLGHQVATDYIRLMMQVMPKYGIHLPDRELACVPFSSPEGARYFDAMAAAANFAFANRQLITWEVRQAWEEQLGPKAGELDILYDLAHNIAKIEEHEIDGKKMKMIIHRKGATRSFEGQPVLIPGSMGTASYVLVGTKASMNLSWGSSCHGAGRRLSRHEAKRQVQGRVLEEEMERQGIHVAAGSMSGLAEEAPIAYKDVESVVDVVDRAGLAKKVARLKPCAVIKG